MHSLKPFLKNNIFLILIMILIVAPVSVYAFNFDPMGAIYSFLGGMGLDFSQGLVGTIIGVIAGISLTILDLGFGFLNWTSSGDFVNQGMTSSMDNPLISQGWTAIRNIANILLVFGLVAVAISIMLEYQETKAKKMLINFVLIALLINFTPVICDTIIDIANSLMNAILRGGAAPQLKTALANRMNPQGLEDITTVIVLAIFCVVSAAIYFLYGVLFMFRYIQLWLLIIISPIAFASKVFLPTKAMDILKYILPEQCMWDAWWKDFMNWTFIGIPAAFSIYLSNLLMGITFQNPTAILSAPSGELEGVFSLLFSYLLPIGVLYQGFFMTMNKAASSLFDISGKLKNTLNTKGGNLVGYARGKYASGKRVYGAGKKAYRTGKSISQGTVGRAIEGYRSATSEGKGAVWATMRGVKNATLGAGEGRRVKKASEENQRKKDLETKAYNDLKNAPEKIDSVLKNKNVHSEEGRALYNAAIKLKLEQEGALGDNEKEYIKNNTDKLSDSSLQEIAKTDSKLAVEILSTPGFADKNPGSINEITSTLVNNKKGHVVSDLIKNKKFADSLTEKTRKQIISSNPELAPILKPPSEIKDVQKIIRENTEKGASPTSSIISLGAGMNKITMKNGKINQENEYKKSYGNLTEKQKEQVRKENSDYQAVVTRINALDKQPSLTQEEAEEMKDLKIRKEIWDGEEYITDINTQITDTNATLSTLNTSDPNYKMHEARLQKLQDDAQKFEVTRGNRERFLLAEGANP